MRNSSALLAVLLAGVGAPAFPAATPPAAPPGDPQIAGWRRQAKENIDQHRYPQAMDLLVKVLQVSPSDLEAKKDLLEISRAAWNWEEGGRLKPGELEQARAQALEFVRQRRAQLAKTDAELDLVRNALDSRSNKMLLSSSINLTRASEEEFLDAHFTAQAKIYLEQLQERMRTALMKGDLKEPKDVHAAKGFLYYQRGLLEPALQEWQDALSQDPSDLTLKEQIGWLGNKIKLASDREKIADLSQEAAKLYDRGLYEKAAQDWSQVLALDPRKTEAITGLAEAQRKLKAESLGRRLAKARAARADGSAKSLGTWVAVLEVDPGNAEALAAIKAWRAARPQKPDSAAAAAKAAQPRAVAAPQEAEDQYAVGMAFYSQGELAPALQAMQKALELDPTLRKAKIAVERIRAETGQ